MPLLWRELFTRAASAEGGETTRATTLAASWAHYFLKEHKFVGHRAPPDLCAGLQTKKAADMISRLCSIVESFRGADSYALAEKLLLVRFDNRAATGIRGVLSPRAPGQFGGVGHFGYGPLQL